MDIEFEWDLAKEKTNISKHDLSFSVAAQAFFDPLVFSIQDRFENGEYRWKTMGRVDGCIVLVIANTFRHNGNLEVVRLISARRASKNEERKFYERTF